MTSEQEQLVLDNDQFGDDFSGPGDKLLSDKFVNGRKAHTCSWCVGPIAVGERHRVAKAAMDSEIFTARYCGECCDAMLKDEEECDCQNLADRMRLHDPEKAKS